MKRFITAMLIAVAAIAAYGESWSLERCINYAIANNISIQMQQLQVDADKQSVTEAKDGFLPQLSASAGQSFSIGRGLTAENTYANRNTSNFQWGVNLSVPLFQGLSEYRRLDVAKASLQKTLYECEAAKDDVTLNVISLYLQVLYCKEVEQSAEAQLELSEYEVKRREALVEAGKVAEADLLDAQSQLAQDRLQVVTAKNDTQVAMVNLTNLLQLRGIENFDVLPVDDNNPILPSAEAVYNDAMSHNHTIMANRQGIEVAESNIRLAKSGYIPRLNFNTSLGSSYYTVSGMVSESFGRQMDHNFSTYFGFSLSVPIFDGFSTRNSVRRAKLQRMQAQLQLDQASDELYKTIQLAYYQARGAHDRFFTSLETLDKTQKSFEATSEKYNLGRATPYEFEQAKSNLYRTQIASIQAHYEYLLRHRILIFYRSPRS